MTEQELNNRITEILKVSEKDARLCQTSGGRRTGRQYRRIQRVRHDDRLLFLIQHSGYAPNIGYIIGDYEEKMTLLHSGLHIKYMKSSSRQQYLKQRGNRLVRKYCGLSGKGNRYRKVRRDLSRSVFAKQCAIRIDKQQKERYSNVVIDNDVII